MKILELTTFSAGICGVFARVKEESIRLSKEGHEVMIFSTNYTKGSKERAPLNDKLGKVIIKRFPSKRVAGESYTLWSSSILKSPTLIQEIIKYNPDVIIAHSYRHTHTHLALNAAKKINSKVFLVTHAPFIEGNKTRSHLAKIYIPLYDSFIGRFKLKQFDKVLAISKWEIPKLKSLGVNPDKIEYTPNGIPEEFFSQKKSKESPKLLFLGRISPIKDLETLIHSIALIKNKKVNLEIVGPAEGDYLSKLKYLISSLNLESRISFSPPIYNLKEKISKIDSSSIFVLPSKSEAMPQSLIEAMAREKIVISSNNQGSKDIIQNNKTGYLFQIGNSQDLANKVDVALSSSHTNIRKQAKKSVEQFEWTNVIKKIIKVISN